MSEVFLYGGCFWMVQIHQRYQGFHHGRLNQYRLLYHPRSLPFSTLHAKSNAKDKVWNRKTSAHSTLLIQPYSSNFPSLLLAAYNYVDVYLYYHVTWELLVFFFVDQFHYLFLHSREKRQKTKTKHAFIISVQRIKLNTLSFGIKE